MKNFEFDVQYATSISLRTEHHIRQRADETSEDFLIRKLKDGSIPIISIESIDHPEFTKLREQLGKDGYITIERGWWNGDRVVKPFSINGVKFKKDGKFPCAAAIHYDLTRKNVV